MTGAEFYANMAGVTGAIGLIVFGIYWLIHCIVGAIIDSSDRPYETESESQDSAVSETKSELLADAAAKSLQLNMELIDATNRMNAVAFECEDDTF